MRRIREEKRMRSLEWFGIVRVEGCGERQRSAVVGARRPSSVRSF